MSGVERIVVIYNPKSTGNSYELARRFQRKVRRALDIPVTLVGTKAMGHGEALARKYADMYERCMIVVSSGDGGYHEAVNGVLTSTRPETILGLLPGGNANDHYNFIHHGDVVKRIGVGRTQHLDVLKVTSSKGWTKYVHSYAGLGLTAQINDVLSQYDFNPLREAGLVVRHLFDVRSVSVMRRGQRKRLDNVLFLNGGRMSKFFKNNRDASITDGKFEVIEFRTGDVRTLMRYVFRAVTVGLDYGRPMKTYTFTCCHDMSMQMDGEQVQLSKDERLTIAADPKRLRCII